MLKYLIQVLQNTLPVGILFVLFLLWLATGDRPLEIKRFYKGLAAGFVAAFVLAVFKYKTPYVNREYFIIGTLSLTILLELVLVVILSARLRGLLQKAERWFLPCAACLLPFTLIFYGLPDILLYPTEFRAAGESVWSTDFLFRVTGWISGLVILSFSLRTLFTCGKRLSSKVLCKTLLAGLVFEFLIQGTALLQPLLARRIIPMRRWLFVLVKSGTNRRDLFLLGLMILSLSLPFLLWIKNRRPEENGDNPAQRRKMMAAVRKMKRTTLFLLSCYGLTALTLTAGKWYDGRAVALSPAESVAVLDGEIHIPLTQIADGRLHRFQYQCKSGVEVRFIIIKKNETAWGVGLDACDICGPTGYYERKDGVVCKLCDVVMNKSTIGFKGGCNPVPLIFTIRGGIMVIRTESLEKEQKRFS